MSTFYLKMFIIPSFPNQPQYKVASYSSQPRMNIGWPPWIFFGLEPTNTSLDCRLLVLFDRQGVSANELETDLYFYHTDHPIAIGMGSSSWITDATGSAYQHIQSLPFGEQFIEQRQSSWDAMYKFTGKERDSETGFDYFGARYYDSELSVWLSVDPLADKYPSMSSYMYTAGNPVMLVDPDGREPSPPGEFERCSGFGGINFDWLKRFFKKIIWHTEVPKTHVKTASQQVVRPRWNRGTNKNIKIRGIGQIQFDTDIIEDRLIIIDRNSGVEVVNTGSVATRGNPININLGRGKYKIIVRPNTNPNQPSDNTWYKVTISDQAFKSKTTVIKKLWGFIPYSRKVIYRGSWQPGTYTGPTGALKEKYKRIKGF